MNPDNFENHDMFDRLSSLEELLSSEEANEKINLQKLSFYNTVLSFINQRLNLTIPDLVQLAEMDSLSKELNRPLAKVII